MKTIPLTKGKSAKVSDSDYARLMRHKWSAVTGDGGNTYAVRKVTGNRHIYMHAEILGVTGKTLVDHKNGSTLDNQRGNLRRASRSKNATPR